MNLFVSEMDQKLFLYIAVDRLLKCTLLLNRFLKHALTLDRFFLIRKLTTITQVTVHQEVDYPNRQVDVLLTTSFPEVLKEVPGA